MSDQYLSTGPALRIVPSGVLLVDQGGAEAEGSVEAAKPQRHGHDSLVRGKATHLSLRAALRRVLAHQSPGGMSTLIDLRFADDYAGTWVAGVEVELHAVLRHLLDHLVRNVPAGCRIEIRVDGGSAGSSVEVRHTDPRAASCAATTTEEVARLATPRLDRSLCLLHTAALRLGARIRSTYGDHGSHEPHLTVRFPPPFGDQARNT